MPPSNASEEHDSSSQASFPALVGYLEDAFHQKGAVNIPDDIGQPFSRKFQHIESCSLRDLQRILEDGRPKNILRLAPSSLCDIVSIVLCFPSSTSQSKLLYLFMDIIRQYRDETTLAPLLSQVQADSITPATVQKYRNDIGKRLASCVVRGIVGNERDIEMKWRMAQLFSVILRGNSVARQSVMQMAECRGLTSILEKDNSYILRVLLADSMRELLYNGGERAVLKQLTGAPRIIDDLPLSKRPDSAWMSKVIDHLNQIDLEQKVAEKTERIFRVQRLEYGGNTYFGSTSTFMATVSSEITFLVPNGSDMLTLFFLPVTDDTILTSIASESQSSLSSSIVEINYVGNDGYRIINGSKSATDSITITFCDVESADVFLTMVEEQRTMNATGQAPANSNVQSERARKYSMAFVDLSVTNDESEHEAEVPSPFRSLPPQTFQKKSSPAAALSPNAHSVSKAANEKDMGKRHFTAEDDPSHSGGQHKSKSVQCQPTRRDGSKKSGEGTTRRESNSNSMAATNKLTDEDQLPGSDDSFDSQPEITNEPGVKVFSNPPKLVASENKRDLLDEENNTSEIIAGKTANKRKIPRGGSSRTMARHAEPRTEQKATMSIAAPVKVGLKRRSIIDSPVDEKSSHVDHTSDGDEYDLPSPEVEPARPTKKAKGSKQSTRKAATADSADDGEVEKQASTTKGHKIKRSNTKQRTSKVPNKTGEKTAASTRARRSTKAPIRIETSESDFSGKSDDNFQGSAGRKSNGSPSEEGKVDDDDDDAEVSPLKEQATETSIRGPTLDFEADSRNSFVTMEREKQIPPTKDALARTSSHQHFPSKRMAKAMIEGVIPRASNGLPRDPSIVHFEARGPTNQAILRDKSASETPEILAVEEGDEREKESDLEAVAKSLEDETTRLLQLPAEDDLAEPNTETSIADFDDRAEILVEQPTTISPESSDVSSPDQSCEESSEYVEADESCEAAEESAAPDELKCENLQKPYITPSGPRTPLLEDSEVGDVSLRMKEPPAPRHRRSIGLGTILAQDYPMAEKDINTGKMRSILRAGQLKDVKIGQDVTPAQDGITNPDTSASRGSNDSPSILAMATPTMPRERGFKVRSKYAMPPPPGENKADLAAGGRPMQAPSIPLRSMVNRQAAVSTVLPRKAPEQPSESTRSAPVRVKKTNQNLKDVSQAEIEMPPETPLFFCTRLNLRAPVLPESGLVVDQVKVSANKDTDQQAGNRSVTLVNDESFSGLRSTLWPRRRRRRSESSEGISLADSHSHGNEFDAETHPEAPRQVEVRDSQHGLLDAILSISNDVLLRFGVEEDATKVKVQQFHRGGEQIVQTLTDSWNERLDHEYQRTAEELRAEEEILIKALQLVGGQAGSLWRGLIGSDHVARKVQKKTRDLSASIEALRNGR